MKRLWLAVCGLSMSALLSSDKKEQIIPKTSMWLPHGSSDIRLGDPYGELLIINQRYNSIEKSYSREKEIIDILRDAVFREERLRILIKDYKNINERVEDIFIGEMPVLNHAIRCMNNNAWKGIEILLEHGADPNIPADYDGKSAFQIYCRWDLFKHPQLLDTFLAHKADINQKDENGDSIIRITIDSLILYQNRIQNHEKKLVKRLIQKADCDSINYKNNNGHTIISKQGLLKFKEPEYINHILETLLEFGVNPCDKDTIRFINKSHNSKIKQEYLKLIPKWKEECKNYFLFKKFERKYYTKPLQKGKTPILDEPLLNRIRDYTYTWDVSKVWKVWRVLSNDAAKKDQEANASLMKIEC